jgi:hypothetical protein
MILAIILMAGALISWHEGFLPGWLSLVMIAIAVITIINKTISSSKEEKKIRAMRKKPLPFKVSESDMFAANPKAYLLMRYGDKRKNQSRP